MAEEGALACCGYPNNGSMDLSLSKAVPLEGVSLCGSLRISDLPFSVQAIAVDTGLSAQAHWSLLLGWIRLCYGVAVSFFTQVLAYLGKTPLLSHFGKPDVSVGDRGG